MVAYHGAIVDCVGKVVWSAWSCNLGTIEEKIANNWQPETYWGIGNTAGEAVDNALLYVREAA